MATHRMIDDDRSTSYDAERIEDATAELALAAKIADATIRAFGVEATADPVHAMRNAGERTMRAQFARGHILRMAAFVNESLVAGTDSERRALFADRCRKQAARLADDFLGSPFGFSLDDTGPWHRGSTCPITNMMAIAECDAARVCAALFNRMADILGGAS